MAIVTTKINPVDGNSRPSTMGGFFKTCGIVTLDAYTPEVFKWICAGAAGGDIVVEGVDGNFIYLPAVPAGGLRPVIGRRVVTSGVISGNTYNTTATPVIWYGGE